MGVGFMNRLFMICYDLVNAHTSCRNQETKEILAASILSLFLLKGNDILTKMPELLQHLTIYSDQRSVQEVIHQEMSPSTDTTHLDHAIACICREYQFHGNKGFEKRSLIIPKNSYLDNPIQVIEKTTHELVHLLRFGDMYRQDGIIYLPEGIATKIHKPIQNTRNYQYQVLEEAIVQDTALKATNLLLSYSDEITNSSIIRRMNQRKNHYHSNIYEAHVILLNQLMEDTVFKQLVDDTMKRKTSTYLSYYYNSKMKDKNAFDRLNYFFTMMDNAIEHDQANEAVSYVEKIKNEIARFKNNQKIYKK